MQHGYISTAQPSKSTVEMHTCVKPEWIAIQINIGPNKYFCIGL